MSREIVIKMRDDLDRSLDATETVELGVNGVIYKIDLCEENAKTLYGTLAPYTEAAHEKVSPRKRNDASLTKEQRQENQAIRKWAREHGFDIGKTGQIPIEIREAYRSWRPGRTGGEAAKEHSIKDKELRDQIRAWGNEHGHSSHRGFLSNELVKAYEKAHGLKVSA